MAAGEIVSESVCAAVFHVFLVECVVHSHLFVRHHEAGEVLSEDYDGIRQVRPFVVMVLCLVV
jgi:hypothetical protein